MIGYLTRKDKDLLKSWGVAMKMEILKAKDKGKYIKMISFEIKTKEITEVRAWYEE